MTLLMLIKSNLSISDWRRREMARQMRGSRWFSLNSLHLFRNTVGNDVNVHFWKTRVMREKKPVRNVCYHNFLYASHTLYTSSINYVFMTQPGRQMLFSLSRRPSWGSERLNNLTNAHTNDIWWDQESVTHSLWTVSFSVYHFWSDYISIFMATFHVINRYTFLNSNFKGNSPTLHIRVKHISKLSQVEKCTKLPKYKLYPIYQYLTICFVFIYLKKN